MGNYIRGDIYLLTHFVGKLYSLTHFVGRKVIRRGAEAVGLTADVYRVSAVFQEIGDKLLDLLEWQAKNPLAAWGVASGINFLVEDAEWSYILGLISDAEWLSARLDAMPAYISA